MQQGAQGPQVQQVAQAVAAGAGAGPKTAWVVVQVSFKSNRGYFALYCQQCIALMHRCGFYNFAYQNAIDYAFSRGFLKLKTHEISGKRNHLGLRA